MEKIENTRIHIAGISGSVDLLSSFQWWRIAAQGHHNQKVWKLRHRLFPWISLLRFLKCINIKQTLVDSIETKEGNNTLKHEQYLEAIQD